MKLPKLLKTLLLVFIMLFSFVPLDVLAQYVSGEFDVVVSVNIPDDTFSTVDVIPNTVEIKEPATVIVTVLDNVLSGVSGHTVELVANGLVFNQPTQTSNSQGQVTVPVYSNIPGTYEICANDITDPRLVINISDCTILYVTPVPVPTMVTEPVYTSGVKNSVFWNPLSGSYQYYVEVSTQNNFSSIKDSSGWISGSMYEFGNLSNNTMYFYRVKARNSYGGESEWSNIVFSVQDSVPPTIQILSVGGVGENNTVDWDSNFEVEFVYLVEDNLSLESTEFFCLKIDDTRYECGNTTRSGSTYTTVIQLSDLQKNGIAYLYSQYGFCITAEDVVGNTAESCEASLTIPEWSDPVVPTEPEEPEPVEPPAPIPTVITRVINDIVDTTEVLLDGMFGDLTDYELENINTTTTVATITVGLGTLLGGLIYIPIYLFELILGLLSWLGLRKKGQLSGYVYDSDTKSPISQAVVRVYDMKDKLVWTDVTGSRGFFELALEDGEYRIEVVSGNYMFPSKVIFGKADYPLENVYHGEKFIVEDGKLPEFSIPLDSVELKWFKRLLISIRSRTRIIFKILSAVIFVFGLVFSIYTYYINSNIFNLIIIILYIPSFILVIRGLLKSGMDYGVVRDDNGEEIARLALGLRDMEYKKIVAKRVTDGDGRYRFVVDPGKYMIEVLDTEYEVVSVEEKELKKLSEGSVLVALDIIIKKIQI